MTWCKSILFFLSKKIAAKNLPTVILMSIFLLPHGFGYRFPIGHLDAPRLTLLCVVIFWFVVVSREVLKSKSLALLPGMPLVFFSSMPNSVVSYFFDKLLCISSSGCPNVYTLVCISVLFLRHF